MTEQDKPFDDGPKNRVANVKELVDLILNQWDLSTASARKKQMEAVQSLLKRVIYLWELEAAYKSWTEEVKAGDRHSFQSEELKDFYAKDEEDDE